MEKKKVKRMKGKYGGQAADSMSKRPDTLQKIKIGLKKN
jgi:hypothetical protein